MINCKGINYDVGTFFTEKSSRDEFDPAVVKREMEIIKHDLHCNAIRISGYDVARLVIASELAISQGLEVWLSPTYINADEKEMLRYFTQCAQKAEKLRKESPHVVFVAGCELTLFMQGLIQGDTTFDRFNTFMKPWRLIPSIIRKGSFNKHLNAFLSQTVASIKEHFHGKITYAAGSWEQVAWHLFDFVSVNHYRDARNKNVYRNILRRYFKYGKPVVITEFGCCTYQGAQNKGGLGFDILMDREGKPQRLPDDLIRDEGVQADYLLELLDIFDEEKVHGAFVYTFVTPGYPFDENPAKDMDMASYSVVKTYCDKKGATYTNMPWEPKQSFTALAEYYAQR